MGELKFEIIESGTPRYECNADGLVECGRRDSGEPQPFELFNRSGRARLIVAPSGDENVPRKWFEISQNANGSIIIRNMHKRVPVRLAGGEEIAPDATTILKSHGQVVLSATRALRISSSPPDSGQQKLRSLQSVLPADDETRKTDRTVGAGGLVGENSQAVARLIRIALGVVTDAVGNKEFIESATRATTEIVELDRALVLQSTTLDEPRIHQEMGEVTRDYIPTGWRVVAEHTSSIIDAHSAPSISHTMLDRVARDKSTLIHDPDHLIDAAHSLEAINCAVASPIVNSNNEVVAVLYGDRWTSPEVSEGNDITDLEGTLVEVIAGTIATGVAKQQEAQFRSNLASFFSPRVAGLLAQDRSLLEGQDVEVTVLFCDIRGFSSVTEELGAAETISWINDVMGELTRCVVERDGVLVDYVGDELMAMWGAPGQQDDHAKRATDTAIAMLNAIEVLRARWEDVLPSRFGAGIGINTGMARVGNVGSDFKFKYGVLGTPVNFGSRLQSATKQLGVPCLVSASTIEAAGVANARRIAKLNVVGIKEAFDAYEIVADETPEWLKMSTQYAQALQNFEGQDFGQTALQLGTIVKEYGPDRPSMLLLARAIDQLLNPTESFSPILKLDKK